MNKIKNYLKERTNMFGGRAFKGLNRILMNKRTAQQPVQTTQFVSPIKSEPQETKPVTGQAQPQQLVAQSEQVKPQIPVDSIEQQSLAPLQSSSQAAVNPNLKKLPSNINKSRFSGLTRLLRKF